MNSAGPTTAVMIEDMSISALMISNGLICNQVSGTWAEGLSARSDFVVANKLSQAQNHLRGVNARRAANGRAQRSQGQFDARGVG